jgi:Raf kinase inhibitor-like YbhB/YbcL family protein
MAFTLICPAFANGGSIPREFSCDGSNRSPELRWSGAPPGTRSFALIVHDPDAPKGDFTHWTLFDIPADSDHIDPAAGRHAPGTQGRNDFGQDGYGGPCPPVGHGTHRYVFDLYALDTDSINVPAGSDRVAIEAAVKDHEIGHATLRGTYERAAEDREAA